MAATSQPTMLRMRVLPTPSLGRHDLDFDLHVGLSEARDDDQSRSGEWRLREAAGACLAISRHVARVGDVGVDLDDVAIGHAARLQDLADVLPGELALLFDRGAELALGIEADLARDVEHAHASRHLAAQAVLAGKSDGRWIVELVGHGGLPACKEAHGFRSDGMTSSAKPIHVVGFAQTA